MRCYTGRIAHYVLLTKILPNGEIGLFDPYAEDPKFEGEGLHEKGVCVKGPENLVGKTLVAVSEDFYRPTDVVNLWGDPTKAKTKLGWNPQKTSYEELCRIMAEHDLELAKQEAKLAE